MTTRVARLVRFACLLVLLIAATAASAQTSKPSAEQDVRAKLDAVEAEVERRRAGDPRAADVLVRDLVRVHDLLAGKSRPKADGRPELHVVGMYGPKHWRTSEIVEVTITDRPIVLALCAYEPVRWQIKLAAGATVQRVIVGGYHDQQVSWSETNPPPAAAPGAAPAAAPPPVDVYTYDGKQADYFYAYDRYSDEYLKLKGTLKRLSDVEVTTFQATHQGTGGQPAYIVGPESPLWRAQVIEDELDPLYGEATALTRARTVKELRGARFTALHYISARVQGQICAYTPAKDEWTFLAECDPRAPSPIAQGLAYSAQDDCFFALEPDPRQRSATRLRRIDPAGKLLDAIDLNLKLSREDGPSRQPQLAVLDGGSKVAILLAPRPLGPQNVEPGRCIVVDVKTGALIANTPLRPVVAPAAAEFRAADAHRLWRMLGGADAAEADTASRQLRAGREEAVAALKMRFADRTTPPPSADYVAKLIKQLDDLEEEVRERATSDLIRAGAAVADAVGAAVKEEQSNETQARLKVVLDDVSTPAAKGRREGRLVTVLQEIATPGAIEQLITLSASADDAVAKSAPLALRQL